MSNVTRICRKRYLISNKTTSTDDLTNINNSKTGNINLPKVKNKSNYKAKRQISLPEPTQTKRNIFDKLKNKNKEEDMFTKDFFNALEANKSIFPGYLKSIKKIRKYNSESSFEIKPEIGYNRPKRNQTISRSSSSSASKTSYFDDKKEEDNKDMNIDTFGKEVEIITKDLNKGINKKENLTSKRLKEFIYQKHIEREINKSNSQPVFNFEDLETEEQKQKRIEEDKMQKEREKRRRLIRNGRIQSFKNIREYIRINGFSLKNFLELNPIKPKPYGFVYGDKFLSAVRRNKEKIVRDALEANPNLLFERDYLSQGPFHWAAKLGYANLIELMLEYGKCCNLYDINKRTPLFYAAKNGSLQCVDLLLRKGQADPSRMDLYGVKPVDVATNNEIISLLESYTKKSIVENKFAEVFKNIKKQKKRRYSAINLLLMEQRKKVNGY